MKIEGPPLLLLGCGGVGRALLRLLSGLNTPPSIGIADRTGLYWGREIESVIAHKAAGGSLRDLGAEPFELPAQPCVLIDASTPDNTQLWRSALAEGHAVVTANKVALARPEAIWSLWHPAWTAGRLGIGGTVGAGVPSAAVLRRLLAEGDTVHAIEGVVSGTLHFVIERMSAGSAFSEAVIEAHARGYTEPDPALDLSGADVGRKMVILGRAARLWEEPPSIQIEPLVPASWVGLDLSELRDRLCSLDSHFAAEVERARQEGARIRYVGRATESGVRCGIDRLPTSAPLGRLGPDENGVSLQTTRFFDVPLSISGPGFGPETTARTLLADVRATCLGSD